MVAEADVATKSRRKPIRKLLVILVVLVAILAISVKRTPELTLKVPFIGFIFYQLLTGCNMPPYINYEAFKNDSSWLRDGDVVVSIAAKSGTTW